MSEVIGWRAMAMGLTDAQIMNTLKHSQESLEDYLRRLNNMRAVIESEIGRLTAASEPETCCDVSMEQLTAVEIAPPEKVADHRIKGSGV